MRLSTPADAAAENEVAEAFGAHYGYVMHRYGGLDPIDYWGERDGRTGLFAEVKCRSHSVDHLPTVWLSYRKWLAGTLLGAGTGVPCLFVVRWNGAHIGWVDIAKVDARQHHIGGRGPRANGAVGANDREPVIEVPVASFTFLGP